MTAVKRQAAPEAPTPPNIELQGWRDRPYRGPERCDICRGWGCVGVALPNAESDDHVTVRYRTCQRCKGRGHT